MKDSQHVSGLKDHIDKYIKVNNERFSTAPTDTPPRL